MTAQLIACFIRAHARSGVTALTKSDESVEQALSLMRSDLRQQRITLGGLMIGPFGKHLPRLKSMAAGGGKQALVGGKVKARKGEVGEIPLGNCPEEWGRFAVAFL